VEIYACVIAGTKFYTQIVYIMRIFGETGQMNGV